MLKRLLTHIYNRTKQYPSGVPMVYVPPVARCLDDNLLLASCNSQQKFARVCTVFEFRCFLITNLETPVPVKEGMGLDPAPSLGAIFCSLMLQGVKVVHSVLECSDRRGNYIQVLVMAPGPLIKLTKIIHQSPVAILCERATRAAI